MSTKFIEWKPPKIQHGKLTRWNWMVQYPEGLKLGKYTDIGAFTYINAKYGVTIEDYVQIGSHCSIYSESTIDGKTGQVIIKRNARIGSHSVVMPGVTIGENSIIGAFSFVNKDIPPNVIVFGVPVKVYRRLTDEEIEKLMEGISK
ncbi:acetyltransferase [Thermococcus celericrescens]|uniref:Acetyltransferase n=1 Tax=Thermococcus celericrescens TaxID=227598 RepID=A0A124EBG0_9EURY|nr:acyltransferase [Thermococcus celericrescens]KUH33792.1 acetyltransferase [Thermococcus celericrescens]